METKKKKNQTNLNYLEKKVNQIETIVMEKIAEIIKTGGKTEYKYYAIPVTWHSDRGRREGYHSKLIAGLDKHEITKEEWLSNKDDSEKIKYKAFMSKYKMSYKDYTRRVSKEGWREKMIKWLEDDSNFTA